MTNQRDSQLSAGRAVRSLFRHTKKALVVFLLVATATVCWIIFANGEYESVAKVYVRVGRENNTLDPSATTGQTINIQQTLESEINSMLEVMSSRDTINHVIADVGLDAILANDLADDDSLASSSSTPSVMGGFKNWLSEIKHNVAPVRFAEGREELAIAGLLSRTSFSAPKKSNVIRISCKAGHPALAQQIASSWTRAFIEEQLRITRTEGSLHFFTRQTQDIEDRLLKIEKELNQVKSSAGLVSIEGQRRVLENQTSLIHSSLLTNNSLLHASEARLTELKTIFDSLLPKQETNQTTSESHQGWNNLRERLFELQIRESDLRSRYEPANPEVIAVEKQRQQVEKILATQSKSAPEAVYGPNPTYQLFQQQLLNEQAQVVSLRAEKKSLEQLSQENLSEQKKLNENEVQISDLERQHQVFETSYLVSVSKMEQAATLQAMENADISSVSELQRASFVARPIGMGRAKKLLLGVLLGIISGLAVAFISEYFDRTFASASHVECSLELPVLASIPQGRRQFLEVN